MEWVNTKIISKISQSGSHLYQESHETNDFPLNYSKFWLRYAEFEALQENFPYFSPNPLISGILFSKRKENSDKSQWFQSKFFTLFKDRLVLHSKKEFQIPKKVLVLKGVHLKILEEFLEEKELSLLTMEGTVEKKSLVLWRKQNFEIFFAGTDEMHRSWVENLRKCCILHKFKSKYKFLRTIAQTASSLVFEASSLETGECFAVKEFIKEKIVKNLRNSGPNPKENERKFFLSVENEINVLKSLDHDKVLQIKEVYESKRFIRIISEELKGGDLYHFITRERAHGLKEKEILIIMKQIVSAMKYLHERFLLHRDIKLENILFRNFNGLEIKIGDFGLAEYEKKQEFLFKRCGTPGYVAPEVLLDQKFTQKCDCFSLGVLLYIMITGKPVFSGKDANEVLVNNKNAEENLKRIEFKKLQASRECVNFIKHLLQTNPEHRFSIEEAANHHWLTGPKTPSLFANSKKLPVFKALNNSPMGKALYLQAGFFKFKSNIATSLSKHSEINENNSETSQTFKIFNENSKKNGSKTIENSPEFTENEHCLKFLSPQSHKRNYPALSDSSLANNQLNLLENETKDESKENAGNFEEKKEVFAKNNEKKPPYRKKCSSILSTNQKTEGENEQILKIFPNMTTILSLKSLFHFEQQQIKSEKAGFLTKNELISSNVLQKAIFRKASQISPQEKP